MTAAASAAGNADDRRRGADWTLLRRLWPFLRPHGGWIGASLATLAALSAVQLVQPALLKVAIDGPILGGRLGDLTGVALAYAGALAAEFGLRYAQLYTVDRTGQALVFDIRQAVYEHLLALPASYFDTHPVGRSMTRVTSDVESLVEAFNSGLVSMLADLAKMVAIVVLLLWLDWRLALVAFAILPPMAAATTFFRRRMRAAYREIRRQVARLNAFLQEQVQGLRLIQVFGREHATRDEFDALNAQHRNAELRGVVYDATFSAVAELFGALTLAAILASGGALHGAGSLTFGTLVAFIAYAQRFFEPVQQLSQRFAVMQAALASAERIFALLDTPAEPGRAARTAPAISTRTRADASVAFEDVTFSYDGEVAAVDDVSLVIGAGETIGVAGWTGSGKSTLVKLLVRLYEPQRGRITLGGDDIRSLDLVDLRRRIGVVVQEHFLFADTLLANVTLNEPHVSRAAAVAALERAGAGPLLERLPRGVDEPILERGANLSVGEKQIVCLARALAHEPAVLVLDEATASVDPLTQERLAAAIADGPPRTTIVIAHRLAAIRDADRIAVLHRGRLVEWGPHDALLARPGGRYRALWELQALTGGAAD